MSTSSSNTNDVAFVLPSGFRPAKYVNVPVDMCNATGGELNIAPTGVVQVISEGANSNATCFTSLDGVSFALSSRSFTPLPLQPGWTQFGKLYRKAAARVVGGIVHLEGEIKTAGTNPAAFTLSPTSFTALTLRNGWTNAPFGTANAAARGISGIVHFEGAISTTGTNPDPFILPAGFRPAHEIIIPVDLCSGNNGRLDIQPTGVVTVEAENSGFSQAQCLISLDGASFAP